MQFNFFHLLILSVFAVVFFTPVQSAPSHSEADIEALMGLQEQVQGYLGNFNLSPAAKKQIEDMMAAKQAAIENSFNGKK